MNRMEATGLAFEAAIGKRIIVITRTVEDNPALVDLIAALPEFESETVKVRRANGEQRIDYLQRGSIRFRSQRQGTRGMPADIIYLHAGVGEEMSTEQWDSLNASLSASPHHELIST